MTQRVVRLAVVYAMIAAVVVGWVSLVMKP
jgi:hypothetical protein